MRPEYKADYLYVWMKEIFIRFVNLVYIQIIHDGEAFIMKGVPKVTLAPVISPKRSKSLSAVVMGI